MAVAWSALREDGAGGDIEGGEERRRAMADVASSAQSCPLESSVDTYGPTPHKTHSSSRRPESDAYGRNHA